MNIQKERDRVNKEQQELATQHQALQQRLQEILIKINENNGVLKFLQLQSKKEEESIESLKKE